jgi:uncharacterized membrane protein
MRRDNVGPVTTAAVALVIGAGQLLSTELRQSSPATVVPQIVTGIALALLLPGYALSLLLLPRTTLRRAIGMSAVRRGMWTVGLSLTVTVLGGLLLNLTPLGLTRTNWTILLTALTVLAAVGTAVDRRRHRPRTQRRPPAAQRFWGPATIRSASYGLGALMAVTAAIWLAYSGAAGQTPAPVTQLWLIPQQATPGMATVGIRNNQADAEQYSLSIHTGTRTTNNWQLTVAAGRTWQLDVPIPSGQPLTATLTQADRTATQVVTLKTP